MKSSLWKLSYILSNEAGTGYMELMNLYTEHHTEGNDKAMLIKDLLDFKRVRLDEWNYIYI